MTPNPAGEFPAGRNEVCIPERETNGAYCCVRTVAVFRVGGPGQGRLSDGLFDIALIDKDGNQRIHSWLLF